MTEENRVIRVKYGTFVHRLQKGNQWRRYRGKGAIAPSPALENEKFGNVPSVTPDRQVTPVNYSAVFPC